MSVMYSFCLTKDKNSIFFSFKVSFHVGFNNKIGHKYISKFLFMLSLLYIEIRGFLSFLLVQKDVVLRITGRDYPNAVMHVSWVIRIPHINKKIYIALDLTFIVFVDLVKYWLHVQTSQVVLHHIDCLYWKIIILVNLANSQCNRAQILSTVRRTEKSHSSP